MSNDLELELINDIAKFTHNPKGFVLYAFPWGEGSLKGKTIRDWQAKVLDDIGKALREGKMTTMEAIQYAIASGHGIGKSALVAWLVLWAMSTFEDTKGVVTANTENQLKTKTWAEVAKWYQLMINKHWFKLTATAIFSSDSEHEKTWRIDMVPWSINNTEAFAGLHNEGKRIIVIFDEGSAIPDVIWEVTEGALTDENTEIVWAVFGNPTRNTGRFRECFRRYKHRWMHEQIDSRAVEGTNKNQIKKWEEDYGENSDFFKVRVRGMFPAASFKQYISTADVDEAFGRHLAVNQYSFAPIVIALDPAWEGDDDSAIVMRQGLMSKILETFPKNDNDIMVANKLARYEDDLNADAVFIDMGYGTGIYSAGKTLGRQWRLVSFAEKPIDPGCLNKRAEIWKEMRDWLKGGGAIPPEQTLYDELIGPETAPRIDGKLQLESKDAMKKRGLPSPNIADALALTFAYPVRRKSSNNTKKFTNTREYNPLGD